MEKSFSQVNEAFEALKSRFQAGEISRQDFIEGMKKLRIRDDEGRFWMIGAQTGKWYFFDGKDWIQSEPPSQAAKAAICIYCGFENRIDATSCARCGGTIGEEPTKCPDCGSPLSKPFMACPKCGTVPGGEVPAPPSAPAAGTDTSFPPKKEIPAYSQPRAEIPSPPSAEKAGAAPAAVPGLGGEIVIKAIQPASLFFFWGGLGLLAGIVAGALIGATGALKPRLGFLPVSLLQLQGTLFGALLDAVVGGVLGFLALGSIAFGFGLLANLILTVTGGIQFRTGRPEAAIGKKKKKRTPKGLSLTADGAD